MEKHLPPILASLSLLLTLTVPAAHAASLLWDADTGTADAQDGSGTWATDAGNWRNTTTSTDNQNWANGDTHNATFGAGVDGTYAITLSGTVQAGGGISFANGGYTLSGAALSLATNSTVINGPITVAANKTATISSAITYANNAAANIMVDSGGTLNLGGGAGNSQYIFSGGGTVNLTAGNYNANVGTVNVSLFNQTGGTFDLSPGAANGYFIGSAAGQSVNYTLSTAGTLTLNNTATNSGASAPYLALGNNAGSPAHISTLTVQNGGTLTIATNTPRAGELRLAASANASATLDVQGGTVGIGAGNTTNRIYFFKAGADAGYAASLNQSGGTVTANGIQFGGTSGTYDPASSAALQLSGGTNYIGAQGITRGSAAANLPVTIQLQGGVLGADQAWSSSLDMKLGATGGGVTIQAADSGAVARNITLSGNLSNDGAVNGTLAKTGAGILTLSGTNNTYAGATTILAGQLKGSVSGSVSSNTAISISAGGQLFVGYGLATMANNFTLSGTGTPDITTSGITGGVGALRVFNNHVYTGPFNLTGDTRIGVVGTSVGNTFNGQISGSGGLEFLASVTRSNITHTFILGNTGLANSYMGNTTISVGYSGVPGGTDTNNKCILKLAASDQIPNGGGKGIVVFNGTDADHQTILELNGFNETVNGVTNVAAAGAIIRNTSTGASTLTMGSADTTSAFSGQITDGGSGKTLALTKIGAGTLTLSGANTYLGHTTISNGTLALGGSGSISSTPRITVAGGAMFDVSGATPAYSLGSSTTLGNSGPAAVINGTNNCSVGTLRLVFDGVQPTLIQTNGTMTLSASTVVTVNNIGATLVPGTNVLIAAATGARPGLVTGPLPASVSVTGNGSTGAASLVIDGAGNLILVIGNEPVQVPDPFSDYLTNVPPILSTISMANSGSGPSAITTWRFQFSSRDGMNTVYGIMVYPQLAGVYPGILWLHGGGSNAEGILGLAQTMAAQGYVSLAIDQPGLCGVNNTPYSDGPWKYVAGGEGPRFTVTPGPQSSTLADAEIAGLEAFNLLRAQANVNPAKMGISGTSWGGYSTTMLSGLLTTNVTAAYSLFGCGYYDKGSFWSGTSSNQSAGDRAVWLTYLDAGRRAQNIKAAYFIEAPSNDTYFWPPAVQATLNAIPTNKNQVITPNLNHVGTASSSTMRQLFFNYHLKGAGSPFGTIRVASLTPQGDGGKNVVMMVGLPGGVTASTVQLFYSAPSTNWQSRSWVAVNATPTSGSLYGATLPAAAVAANADFYVYLQDSRTVVISSLLYNSVTGQSSPLPSLGISPGSSGVVLSGTNQTAFTPYRILTTTNLANPLGTWVPIQTNLFDVFGRFQTDISASTANPNRFYRLAVP